MMFLQSSGMPTRFKFGELVASLGLDYEKGCWPNLHKLAGSWSCSSNEPKAGRN